MVKTAKHNYGKSESELCLVVYIIPLRNKIENKTTILGGSVQENIKYDDILHSNFKKWILGISIDLQKIMQNITSKIHSIFKIFNK